MPVHAAFLRYFDEVCRCGSIRLAARRLHVASSAVNRQILRIERELGVTLLERVAGGVRPTAAGRVLAAHVGRTLADADRALTEIQALGARPRHAVTIAGQESVIAHFLPPALVELHAVLPEVSTGFKAASGTALVQMLLDGSADVALAFDPDRGAGVDVLAECCLPVGAVMRPDHPLASRGAVDLPDCAPYPVVLPDRSWPLRGLLDAHIAGTGARLDVVTSSNSIEFIKTMVDQALGIGLQTVVGIESKVARAELVHVPLIAGGRPVEQVFAVCAAPGRGADPLLARVLELLGERLAAYAADPIG